MPFIPQEQLARAREMDLLTYLRCCEPEELVSVGGNAYLYAYGQTVSHQR